MFYVSCFMFHEILERIEFRTEDNIIIVGDILEFKKEAPWALLLHMMPATRQSWYSFMEKLREAGFNSLAIDFRGHGESVRGRTSTRFAFASASLAESRRARRVHSAVPRWPSGGERRRFDLDDGFKILDYKKFTDVEQQAKILDVRAAVKWLGERGADKNNLIIVGASIGANLALQYLTENLDVQRGVLLSPGLDYRGIKTSELIKKLSSKQRLLLVASKDDAYSFQTVRELHKLAPQNSDLLEFSGLGHGTTMLEKNPEIMNKIIIWLRE